MIKEEIKILEEIIKQEGKCVGISCVGISCIECPLIKICTYYKSSFHLYNKQKYNNENYKYTLKLLRQFKLEKILNKRDKNF
jgi:hypothetical protein